MATHTLSPGKGVGIKLPGRRTVIVGRSFEPHDDSLMIQFLRPPTKEDISYSLGCSHCRLTEDGTGIATSVQVSREAAVALLISLAEALNCEAI